MTARFRAVLWLIGTLIPLAGTTEPAPEPVLPYQDDLVHVGVATCAGSNCHGASAPLEESAVMQDEYFVWRQQDAHANAFSALQGDKAERIAANLGIEKAHEAPECLTCHTDHVPEDRRGRRFQLADGVGCEACHGGAQDWLGTHIAGASREDSLAAGLYPLEDPEARARVCLGCHMGNDDKEISHRLMGAGHPELWFELDLFTAIQPAHFHADDSYRARKDYAPPARSWAIGQLAAARQYLDGLLSEQFASPGLFPELKFFDCSACHHPMRPPRWEPALSEPLGPGRPRLADAHLRMSAHVLTATDSEQAETWRDTLRELHVATTDSAEAVQRAARELRDMLDHALPRIGEYEFSPGTALSVLTAVSDQGLQRDAADLSTARQVYAAAAAISAHLREEYQLDTDSLDEHIESLYQALDSPEDYRPEAFREALTEVKAAVEQLDG